MSLHHVYSHHDLAVPILSTLLFMHVSHLYSKFKEFLIYLFCLLFKLKGMSPYIRTKNRTFGMSCDWIVLSLVNLAATFPLK